MFKIKNFKKNPKSKKVFSKSKSIKLFQKGPFHPHPFYHFTKNLGASSKLIDCTK